MYTYYLLELVFCACEDRCMIFAVTCMYTILYLLTCCAV